MMRLRSFGRLSATLLPFRSNASIVSLSSQTYSSVAICVPRSRSHHPTHNRCARSLVSSTTPTAFALTTIPASRQSDDSISKLIQWTNTILDRDKYPLASLSISDIEDVFSACHVWLGYGPEEDDMSNYNVEPAVGRNLDRVHRLLERLVYEHNVHVASRRFGSVVGWSSTLNAWLVLTGQAWLQVSERFPDAPMAVEKARVLWDALPSSPTNREGKAVSLDCFALVNAYVRLSRHALDHQVRYDACRTAVDLLLSQTPLNCQHSNNDALKDTAYARQQVKISLHASIRQAIHLFQEDESSDQRAQFTKAVSLLLEQTEKLASRDGWTDIRLPNDILHELDDTIFFTEKRRDDDTNVRSSDDNVHALSDFEQQTLQSRILDRIAEASSIEDQATVEELIESWRDNVPIQTTNIDDRNAVAAHAQLWNTFAQAVTRYYLRIKDPEHATYWMQIQEQPLPSYQTLSDGGDSLLDTSENCLEQRTITIDEERIQQKVQLIDMWVSKSDRASAPWRATELLESLQSEPGVDLPTSTYGSVTKLWMQHSTNNKASIRKGIDIALQCPTFDSELLSMIFTLLRKNSDDPANPILERKAVEVLQTHLQAMPSSDSSALVEDATPILLKNGLVRTFVEAALKYDTSVSVTLCEHALDSFTADDDPKELIQLLSLLEAKDNVGLNLDFECYKIAVLRLCDMKEESSNECIKTLSHLIALLHEGKLKATQAQAADLIHRFAQSSVIPDKNVLGPLIKDWENKLATTKKV